MKNLMFYVVLFMSFGGKIIAQIQDTSSWSPTGATWVYNVSAQGGGVFMKLQYEKDTLLQQKQVKKLNLFSIEYAYPNPNAAGIRTTDVFIRDEYMYQNNDTIFMLIRDTFRVLYIFNSQAGDAWTITETGDYSLPSVTLPSTDSFVVNSVSNTTFNGYSYTVMRSSASQSWLIGDIVNNIGSLNTPYPTPVDNSVPITSRIQIASELVCYKDATRGERVFRYSPLTQPSCRDLLLPSDSLLTVESIANNEANLAKVFPIPTSGEVFIKFDESLVLSDCTLQVFDSLGRLLQHKLINGNVALDLSAFEAGFYFINIRCEEIFQTFKIVKQSHKG